jgi:heat shock protein HtpX
MTRIGLRSRLLAVGGLFVASVLAYGLVLAVLVYATTRLLGIGSGSTPLLAAVVLGTGVVGVISTWALRRGPGMLLDAIDVPTHEVPADATLSSRVEDHATALGIAPPTVVLVETQEPFVVTVGVRQQTMRIVVSQGLLDLFPVAELDAVLAHELGHVAHRDAQLLTVLSIPIAIAERLYRVGASYWRRDVTVENKYLGPASSSVVLGLYAVVAPLAAICRRLVRQLVPERDLAADGIAAGTAGTEPLINAIARLEDERAAGSLARLDASVLAAFAFVPAASYDLQSATDERGAVDETLPGHDSTVGSLGTDLRRRRLESSQK